MTDIELSEFMLTPAGELFHKGVSIGRVDNGEPKLDKKHKKLTAAATEWLREESEKPSEDAATFSDGNIVNLSAVLDKKAQASLDRARKLYEGDEEYAAANNLPPVPKQNPMTGDKTEGYVQWLHDHRIDEFKIRYGVTGRGKVPVTETNPNTGLLEVIGYREVYFAKRKTHLTELDSARDGLATHESWDA